MIAMSFYVFSYNKFIHKFNILLHINFLGDLDEEQEEQTLKCFCYNKDNKIRKFVDEEGEDEYEEDYGNGYDEKQSGNEDKEAKLNSNYII